MNQIERRSYSQELRAISESRVVEGYALLFNTLSNDLGGFREQIAPEALNGVIEISDVFALLNHDRSRGLLARSKQGTGSLSLSIDDRGLKYSFTAPNTSLGDELIEMLNRGDITESSFAFTIAEGGDKWVKQSDGSYIRTITQIALLYDVSPVYTPAYNGTRVECKRYNDVISADNQELKAYYSNLREELKNL